MVGFARLFRPTYPGFPVEVDGVVELHAAFLNESRTRGPVWCCVTGNPGTLGRTWGTHPLLNLRGWCGGDRTALAHQSQVGVAEDLAADPRSGAARNDAGNCLQRESKIVICEFSDGGIKELRGVGHAACTGRCHGRGQCRPSFEGTAKIW
jgi:hypothetical protein